MLKFLKTILIAILNTDQGQIVNFQKIITSKLTIFQKIKLKPCSKFECHIVNVSKQN